MDLFQRPVGQDPIYNNARNDPRGAAMRAFAEQLWTRYQPLADPHFLDEFPNRFQQRFWEMYLAVALMDLGLQVRRLSAAGPEYYVEVGGRRVWFEAIAPTAGTGADAVPEPVANGAGSLPEPQIVLRLTAATFDKLRKVELDLQRGRIDPMDGVIIAINARDVPHAWYGGSGIPYIVKAVYPVGHLAVVFNRETMEVIETKYQHRPALAKASGASVATTAFLDPRYAPVSAVLYCTADVANHPPKLSSSMILVHNCSAANPIPQGAIQTGREFWVEDDKLKSKEWG